MREEIKTLIERSYTAIDNKDKNLSSQLLDKAFSLATSKEEEREIAVYVRKMLKRNIKRSDVDIKKLLANVRDAVSMSYISSHYFGKERSWLSQRINGNKVNGKQVAFTSEELSTLSKSLANIGNNLISVASEIHQSI